MVYCGEELQGEMIGRAGTRYVVVEYLLADSLCE